MEFRLGGLIGLLMVLGASAPALAAPPGPPSWRELKCTHYRESWTAALNRQGSQGLGPAFLDRHAAFLASGCTGERDVCPRSPEELALANIMVMAAMNSGTASTFPPFACRK